MKKAMSGLILMSAPLSAVFVQRAAAASDLQTYVQQCQTELQFSASEVPAMDCNDGLRFTGTPQRLSAVNDYLIYKKVNDNVDLTVACRWLTNKTGTSTGALSVELIIHNRKNGSTCFFSANDPDPVNAGDVKTAIVSPTNFPAADAYWVTPAALNTVFPSRRNTTTGGPNSSDTLACVGCHVQGPYIASPRIAPYLARFGLLNDGHDTFADMTAAASSTVPHYHVVTSGRYNSPAPTALGNWDGLVNSYQGTFDGCNTCHALARNSPIGDLFSVGNSSEPFLPSIQTDITLVTATPRVMPPTGDTSDYAWINRDSPGSDAMDLETFTASNNSFPVLPSYCGVPTRLEAHPVSALDFTFSTNALSTIPDKLKTFNARDGLLCLDAEQAAGRKCLDYTVSYLCSNGTWTPAYNSDGVSTDNGEHEERATINSLLLYTCGGEPVGIRAQFYVNGVLKQVNGPGDRLQQFAPSGLICKNADQGAGQQCANYVVRYGACRPQSDAYLVKIKNQWVNLPTFTNRFLTTTNNVTGSETRAQAENAQYPSQDWIVEVVSSGMYRLKDVWSGKYLTATSDNDLATVVVADLDASSARQRWAIEAVSGSQEKRLKNLGGSGRYLTVGNYTSDPYYAPIVIQTLSSQNWSSQRWLVR